jgi:hypothetical protein
MSRSLLYLIFVLLIGCNQDDPDQPITSYQKQILSFLPVNSDIVIYMNYDNLKNSEAGKWLFNDKPDEKASSEDLISLFKKESGLLPGKGIKEMIISSSWSGQNTIVLTFNSGKEKIKAFIDKYFIYDKEAVQKRFSTNKNVCLKAFKDSILVLTSADQSDKKGSKNEEGSILENKGLKYSIDNVKNKNYYWVASSQGFYLASVLSEFLPVNPKEDNSWLKMIREYSISSSFDEGIKIYLSISCNNTNDAKLLAFGINDMLQKKKEQHLSDQLHGLLDDIDLLRQGREINLILNLNDSQLKKLRRLTLEKKVNKNI